MKKEDIQEIFTRLLQKALNEYFCFKHFDDSVLKNKLLLPLHSQTIERALHDSCLVSLAKLFDNNRAAFDLQEMLQSLPKEKADVIYAEKKRMQPIINNLYQWRNKFLSHHDKEYIVDTQKLKDDFDITLQQVEELFLLLISTTSLSFSEEEKKILHYPFSK
jgi:hypothetical protein